MDRRNFIKSCSALCLSGAMAASLLESCAPTKGFTFSEDDKTYTFPLTAFRKGDEVPERWKPYVVIRPAKLKFPVCVFRSPQGEYAALLMQCTHRGCELENVGDHLNCPCHGSEFDSKGAVLNPPAEENLQQFPVSLNNNQLTIHLS